MDEEAVGGGLEDEEGGAGEVSEIGGCSSEVRENFETVLCGWAMFIILLGLVPISGFLVCMPLAGGFFEAVLG